MSASYLGDFPADQAVYFMWNTSDSDGASITRATDGAISVYKDNSDGSSYNQTQVTTGVTNDEDMDSLTGIHSCCITTTDAWYETGHDYAVVLSASTIDGQTVNAVLATFSIENRFMRGTDSAATASALSTMQGNVTDIVADTDELQGDDVPGLIAALDVVVDRVEADTQDLQTQIGTAGDGLTAINLPNQTMDITGDITGNLSGSVGSVTGAVGSVTGAVGSVTGHTNQTGDTYALANGATGFAAIDTVVDAILVDTNELQTDWADGGRLDNLLDGAASAGDPWTTALPGAYGAGTAGEIIGDWKNGERLDLILDIIAADTTTDIPALIATESAKIDTINTNTAATQTLAAGATGFAAIDTVVDTILVDTNELQTDWTNAGRLDAILDIIAADTTTDIPALIATESAKIDTINTNTAATQTLAAGATGFAAIDTVVDAILVDTGTTIPGLFTFSTAGIVDANVERVNNVALTGTGVLGDEWGP